MNKFFFIVVVQNQQQKQNQQQTKTTNNKDMATINHRNDDEILKLFFGALLADKSISNSNGASSSSTSQPQSIPRSPFQCGESTPFSFPCACELCLKMKKNTKLVDETIIDGYTPAKVGFHEYPDHYEVLMELPGVKKADIDIMICDGVLTIRATRTTVLDDNTILTGRQDLLNENVGAGCKFGRKLKFNAPVLVAECKSEYKDGRLLLLIPKDTPEPPKEVRIPL